MKKTLIYFAYIALTGLVVWAFAGRLFRQTSSTPQIKEISNNHEDLKLKDLAGKYVLVNFWDSHNAVSRIAAGEYDRFFRSHKNEGMELVSVNTDNDRGLFSELARKDGLDLSRQFHIKDIKGGSIPADYKPRDGFSSYLLNPSGKIIAHNPTVQTLEKYLK